MLIIIILFTVIQYLIIFFSQSHVDEYLSGFQMFASLKEKENKKTVMVPFYVHYFIHVPSISLGGILRSGISKSNNMCI